MNEFIEALRTLSSLQSRLIDGNYSYDLGNLQRHIRLARSGKFRHQQINLANDPRCRTWLDIGNRKATAGYDISAPWSVIEHRPQAGEAELTRVNHKRVLLDDRETMFCQIDPTEASPVSGIELRDFFSDKLVLGANLLDFWEEDISKHDSLRFMPIVPSVFDNPILFFGTIYADADNRSFVRGLREYKHSSRNKWQEWLLPLSDDEINRPILVPTLEQEERKPVRSVEIS